MHNFEIIEEKKEYCRKFTHCYGQEVSRNYLNHYSYKLFNKKTGEIFELDKFKNSKMKCSHSFVIFIEKKESLNISNRDYYDYAATSITKTENKKAFCEKCGKVISIKS